MSTPTEAITASALRDWPLPQPDGSKRSRGTVLAAGGSPSTPGAVLLAGLAALRVGAGVLTMAVAQSVAGGLAVAVPEAAVHGLPMLDGDPDDGSALAKTVGSAQAVLVGPGLDGPEVAERLLAGTLEHVTDDTLLVLDAFVLGVLPKSGRTLPPGRAVLTPNGKEAAFLLDADADELSGRDPAAVARDIADRFSATVSFQSEVAAPDGRGWQVPTGHAGLGTSGSGDVLAGAVAGLLARGADPAQAACWATFLHATAGDRLAPRVGRLGFLARELVDELPQVLVQTEA
jgi:hydroxyethylthiazole kinase-like uncharacterized protein yjeF